MTLVAIHKEESSANPIMQKPEMPNMIITNMTVLSLWQKNEKQEMNRLTARCIMRI